VLTGSESTPAPSSSGDGCCGSGGSVTPVEGAAVLEGGIQKISVDLSSGNYDPNVLLLKAGVPAEITFGRGSGCMGYVQSPDLGFQADLTGGPQTVELPALEPGQYYFACGMDMVPGLIVVE
jgi:plastocyanin domain-containing protein